MTSMLIRIVLGMQETFLKSFSECVEEKIRVYFLSHGIVNGKNNTSEYVSKWYYSSSGAKAKKNDH